MLEDNYFDSIEDHDQRIEAIETAIDADIAKYGIDGRINKSICLDCKKVGGFYKTNR